LSSIMSVLPFIHRWAFVPLVGWIHFWIPLNLLLYFSFSFLFVPLQKVFEFQQFKRGSNNSKFMRKNWAIMVQGDRKFARVGQRV
jgi:hypothetical protein